MTKYPNRYPRTTWKYEKLLFPTSPGTEINVTPEREVPIIPNATKNQGEDLFALKKS